MSPTSVFSAEIGKKKSPKSRREAPDFFYYFFGDENFEIVGKRNFELFLDEKQSGNSFFLDFFFG